MEENNNTKYVVFDLEMCSVPKLYIEQYPFLYETIQIGAVLTNEKHEIIDEFSTYVKPQYGKIDAFIEELTGITNKDIENAPSFEDALQSFMEWIPDDDVKIVSWSDADPIQIRKELANKGLANERFTDLNSQWIDCQKIFSEKRNSNRCFGLSEALYTCEIKTVGREHNGLCDAHNTALLFKKLMEEPELKISRYIISEHDVGANHLTYNLGDIFSKLNLCFE